MAASIDWTAADGLKRWAAEEGDDDLVALVDTARGYPTAWRADEEFWAEDRQSLAMIELAELLDGDGGAF